MRRTRTTQDRIFVQQSATWLTGVAWLALAVARAQAGTMAWTNSAGGDYTNTANWSGGVPDSADYAAFNLTTPYTVDLTTSWTNSSLQFVGNSGIETFNFHSNTLLLTASIPLSLHGVGTTNSVFMNNGTIVMTNGTENGGPYIGTEVGGVDTLTFSNMTLNAVCFGVAHGVYANLGMSIWNLYNSAATISQLYFADTYGSYSGAGTGSILVANGSVLTVSNLINVGYYGNTSGNDGSITVSNGTFNAIGGMNLGYSHWNHGHLNIRDNGLVFMGGNSFNIGAADNSYGSILIDGTNALLTVSGGSLILNGHAGHESTLTINQGACVVSGFYYLRVGNDVGSMGRVTMTGGSLILNHYGLVGGNGSGSTGSVWLVGPNNPVLTTGSGDASYIAVGDQSCGLLVVSNGTFHMGNNTMHLNWNGAAEGHMLVPGGTVQVDGTLDVGIGNSATGPATVLVSNGGVLQNNTLTVRSTGANCWVTNNGGIFQYTRVTPSITPGTFGNVVITNGTISFRGITTADVLCNQSGNSLDSATKVAFFGNNTFQLNAATNATTGQAYTFSTAYGATNWSGLILTNGAAWRGGDLTIGSGGTLAGAGVINNNLTLSGGTLYNSGAGAYIAVASNLTLAAGSSLVVTGVGTNAILMTCAGTLSGGFSSITAPPGFSVSVRNGQFRLQKTVGTSCYFR